MLSFDEILNTEERMLSVNAGAPHARLLGFIQNGKEHNSPTTMFLPGDLAASIFMADGIL
jgi:hypothetical protein